MSYVALSYNMKRKLALIGLELLRGGTGMACSLFPLIHQPPINKHYDTLQLRLIPSPRTVSLCYDREWIRVNCTLRTF